MKPLNQTEIREEDSGRFQKGHSVPRKWRKKLREIHLGKKASKETKEKMSISAGCEDTHHNWKGDEAGKRAMHEWVMRWKGKPKKCEVCGKENQNKIYDWANIDHTYKRILEDYIRMCRSCHRYYDRDRGVKIN